MEKRTEADRKLTDRHIRRERERETDANEETPYMKRKKKNKK